MVRAEPVTVTGAFNFGLKSITKAMHAAGWITTTWTDGPTDGLGAMIGAWWCNAEAGRLGVRMAEIDLMREIATYNGVDVRVMAARRTAPGRGVPADPRPVDREGDLGRDRPEFPCGSIRYRRPRQAES